MGQLGKNSHNPIDGVISVYHYTPIVKKILTNLKYRCVFDAFHEFLQTIGPDVFSFFPTSLERRRLNAVIVPVPLHKAKLQLRGFNQSMFIAQFVAHILDEDVEEPVERVRATKPQASLIEKLERHNNVRNAFQVINTNLIKDKMVILVDDVYTTGATTKEIARQVKKGGARYVFVFSVAKG